MNRIKILVLSSLISLTFIFSSCTKDENQEVSPKNFVKIDDKSYDVTKAFSNFLNQYSKDLYSFQLILTSESISFDETNVKFKGKGDLLVFRIFTPNVTEIPVGVYNFDSTPSNISTFSYGEMFFGVDTESTGNKAELAVVDGNLKITKNGNEYQIEIDVKTLDKNSNEKTITGKYIGVINKANFNK
jgi:hypothetical protein